ncbi:MAG: AbrB/MazE/SpoVT family DNA-binding domain-containing protein [Patescibacteria group bacterium]|nr:AbrB/MazE/SpoVT family DNA-binding domain-containing protein [Patescibacteria group bacterium]
MESTLHRYGNSHAVVIPALFLRQLNIKRGDRIILKIDFNKASVNLFFPDARQLPLSVPAAVRRGSAKKK